MKKFSGFTIIELMFTLAVAAALLVVAVPAFMNIVQNNRVTAQANSFLTAVTLARSEAIKRRDTVNVVADSGTASWREGWEVQDSGGTTLRVFEEMDPVVTFTSTGGNIQFSFGRDGRLTTGADTLQLRIAAAKCDPGMPYTGRNILISQTGNARVERTDQVCP